MNLEVVFSTRANDQLLELYEWLADIGVLSAAELRVVDVVFRGREIGAQDSDKAVS